MFKTIRAVAALMNGRVGSIATYSLIPISLILLSWSFWITGIAFALILVFIFFAPTIETWANRYVQGETIAFYDEVLKDWQRSVGHFHPTVPTPSSRGMLKENARRGQNNILLCKAFLLEFKATLAEERGTGNLPRVHWARLDVEVNKLLHDAEDLPQGIPQECTLNGHSGNGHRHPLGSHPSS